MYADAGIPLLISLANRFAGIAVYLAYDPRKVSVDLRRRGLGRPCGNGSHECFAYSSYYRRPQFRNGRQSKRQRRGWKRGHERGLANHRHFAHAVQPYRIHRGRSVLGQCRNRQRVEVRAPNDFPNYRCYERRADSRNDCRHSRVYDRRFGKSGRSSGQHERQRHSGNYRPILHHFQLGRLYWKSRLHRRGIRLQRELDNTAEQLRSLCIRPPLRFDRAGYGPV